MSTMDRRKGVRRKAWLGLLKELLAVVAISMAASALNLRWDMTGNHMYTLSDSTRAVLDKLEEPVTIRAYITRDLTSLRPKSNAMCWISFACQAGVYSSLPVMLIHSLTGGL